MERKRELKWITQVGKLPRDCPPGGRGCRFESKMAVRRDNKMQEGEDPDKKVERRRRRPSQGTVWIREIGGAEKWV